MMGMCSIAKENNIGCFAGQYAKYEGLTVNTLRPSTPPAAPC